MLYILGIFVVNSYIFEFMLLKCKVQDYCDYATGATVYFLVRWICLLRTFHTTTIFS